MTKREILNYNKRCSEFLGIHNFVHKISDFKLMEFHNNWEWIMYLIEEIEKLGETKTMKGIVDINSHYCKISSLIKNQPYIIVGCFPESPEKDKCNSKQEAVVKAIDKFITWYNKIPKDKIKYKYID